MSDLRSLPVSQRALAYGAVQFTIAYELEQLTSSWFQQEQLELPALLRHAIKKRQIEYLCGRWCARLCFEHLGVSTAPEVGFRDDRSPVWPPGYVGSITHTQGWASAIVAPSTSVWRIGLDIETPIRTVTAQLIKHICRQPAELVLVQEALAWDQNLALTLIFSAKESFYKAIYPTHRQYFGFQAAHIVVDSSAQLCVELATDLSAELQSGQRWPLQFRQIESQLVETLILEGPRDRAGSA